MQKLNIDNPFFKFMDNVGDWLILNVLFVVSCFPIITIGMATTAMYKVALKKIRNESEYIVKEYLQACKKEFKQSTLIWLFVLISGGILFFDILYANNVNKYLNMAIGCLAVLWCFVFSYVFALQAQFENTIKNTIKNALYMAIINLPSTIIIVLLNIVPFIGIFLSDTFIIMAVPIYLIIGFSLTARINGTMFVKIFDRYITD